MSTELTMHVLVSVSTLGVVLLGVVMMVVGLLLPARLASNARLFRSGVVVALIATAAYVLYALALGVAFLVVRL